MSIILFDTWRCEGSSISFQTLHFFSNKVWLCNCLFAPNVTGVGGFFFLLFLSFHLGASNSEIPLCDGKHFVISFASKRAVMSYLLILFVFFGMLLSVNFASNFELFSVSVLCFFFGFPLLFTNWPKRICRNVLCVWLSVVSA